MILVLFDLKCFQVRQSQTVLKFFLGRILNFLIVNLSKLISSFIQLQAFNQLLSIFNLKTTCQQSQKESFSLNLDLSFSDFQAFDQTKFI